jgi:hypothetical protein
MHQIKSQQLRGTLCDLFDKKVYNTSSDGHILSGRMSITLAPQGENVALRFDIGQSAQDNPR